MPPANGSRPIGRFARSVTRRGRPRRGGGGGLRGGTRPSCALSYARRYALFALVGITGEDDLDAPDLLIAPSPLAANDENKARQNGHHRFKGLASDKPLPGPGPSATLRDQFVAEIHALRDGDSLAVWARQNLTA